jgi:hypothetical protein
MSETVSNIAPTGSNLPAASAQRGWICPVCGKGCAPWLTQCQCAPFRPRWEWVPPMYPTYPTCPPWGGITWTTSGLSQVADRIECK